MSAIAVVGAATMGHAAAMPSFEPALAALAARVAEVPPIGAFEPIEVAVDAPAWDHGELALRFAPYPSDAPDGDPDHRRYVAVVVTTPGGQTVSTRWLTAGRHAEVLAALRAPATASLAEAKVAAILASQRRHELP